MQEISAGIIQLIISVVNPVHLIYHIRFSWKRNIISGQHGMDLDVGDTNDFEAVVNFWDDKMFSYNNRIYIPETEYGGIIGDREIITKNVKLFCVDIRGEACYPQK